MDRALMGILAGCLNLAFGAAALVHSGITVDTPCVEPTFIPIKIMPIGRIIITTPTMPSLEQAELVPRQRSKTAIEPIKKSNSLADRIALFEKGAETKPTVPITKMLHVGSIKERSQLFDFPKAQVSKTVEVSKPEERKHVRSKTQVPIAETLPKTPKLGFTALPTPTVQVAEPSKSFAGAESKQMTFLRARSEMSKEPLEQQIQRLTIAEQGLKSVAEQLSQQLDAKEARHEEERAEWQSVLAKVVSDAEKDKKRFNKSKFALEAVQKEQEELRNQVKSLQATLLSRDEAVESLSRQLAEATAHAQELQQRLDESNRTKLFIDTSIQVAPSEDEATVVERPPWDVSSPKLVPVDSSATILSHDSLLDIKMKRLSRVASQIGKKQLSRNQSFFSSYVPVSTRIVQNFESLLQELEHSRSTRKPTKDFVKGLLEETGGQETEVITVSSF